MYRAGRELTSLLFLGGVIGARVVSARDNRMPGGVRLRRSRNPTLEPQALSRAVPNPPIAAFNLSGYLDSYGKNQIAGALAGVPATLSACSCYWFVIHPMDLFASGLIIGGSYGLGSLISVVSHFVIAARLGVSAPEHHKRQGSPDEFLHALLSCR